MPDFVELEPEAIDHLVRICNDIIITLEQARKLTTQMDRPKGFGDFPSAQQLAAGFGRKAKGTPESAYERFGQFIDAYVELRDAFASGGADFLTEQFEWARRIDATGQGI